MEQSLVSPVNGPLGQEGDPSALHRLPATQVNDVVPAPDADPGYY